MLLAGLTRPADYFSSLIVVDGPCGSGQRHDRSDDGGQRLLVHIAALHEKAADSSQDGADDASHLI